MMTAPELFAPSLGSGGIAAASLWIVDLLRGQLVTSIAIIAIAVLGYETLSGSVSLRHAFRVILGCFILLGAPTIALGLIGIGRPTSAPDSRRDASYAPSAPLPEAPPETSSNPFDPYSNNRPSD